MPTVKIPCLQCKEKHVKCDEQRPRCGRCQKKQLSCTRPSRQTVFRHDAAAAHFAKDQQWVNSEAIHFQFDSHATARDSDSESAGHTPKDVPDKDPGDKLPQQKRLRTDEAPGLIRSDSGSSGGNRGSASSVPWNAAIVPATHSAAPRNIPWQGHLNNHWNLPPHRADAPQTRQHGGVNYRRFPLEDVQEACLMRYYVEEIGHWIDLCDEDRHFQLVVPVRARTQPHLLNAIFAVAARHLSRLPQYKTQHGIKYHGQLLPNLDSHSAVEYTLECIPALRRFHDNEDDEYRDSIIATAVILRQLEEIDDEEDGPEHPRNINFLPIVDAVLRSPPSQSLFGRRSLIRASYWMALRQEIYHSFTRRQAPQMILAADYWSSASNANKAVMHTVQVVKWLWGDGTEREWSRLMRQQDHLEQDVLVDFQPIFHKEADKSKGDIFPTLWYASNMEVTTIQQAIMAKSVLLAENPILKSQSAPRSEWRKVENDVRMLMLQLCGIALGHPASPPAILNAAFVIQMYGDYFTDHYERQALRGVVEMYRNAHAWPSKKLTEMFG